MREDEGDDEREETDDGEATPHRRTIPDSCRPTCLRVESSRAGLSVDPMPVSAGRTPLVAAAVGLSVATAAAVLFLRAGGTVASLAQIHIVGLANLVAGIIAWRRRPGNATGPLLVAIGCTWYIVDFETLPVPAVAALAFAARRIVNLVSAYLFLAYPFGRLEFRRDRLVLGFVVAVNAIQIPARLLLNVWIPPQMTHLDRGTSFGCDCPNPFALTTDPLWLERVERWTSFPSVAGALLVMVMVMVRLTTATRPMRRVLWPILFGAVVGLLTFSVSLLSFALTGQTALMGGLSWVMPLARAAVPIGFLVGLLRMKMGQAAVAGLVVGLHGERTPASLERAIAHALHDPAATLGYWSPATGAYVDGSGKVLPLPGPRSGRSVRYVERGDEPLGAIVHDAVLDDDTALLDAVSAAFALAVDRDRLASSVQAQAASARQLPAGPVTFLYTDVEGSTELLGRLGERYAEVLAEERRLIRTIVRQHGGVEIDSRADEFFASFPEDADPAGAAIGIHRRLRDHAWPDGAVVRVRIGLHRGQPQLTDEGYVGLDVHRATRVGSAGHGGQTLLSESARRGIAARLPAEAKVSALGTFRLKGLPGVEPISQLTVPDLPSTSPPLRLSRAEAPAVYSSKDAGEGAP
jgi:class 3 adenylate cyclase